MNSPKDTSLAHLPRSGDKLVDWIFKQFVFFLRRETLRIKRKKYVYTEVDLHRKAVYGLMRGGTPDPHIDILISAAKSKHQNRDEETDTLIHELCHIVFWKTGERYIEQVDKLMKKRLTQEQKNYLKSFIPRHEVKSA